MKGWIVLKILKKPLFVMMALGLMLTACSGNDSGSKDSAANPKDGAEGGGSKTVVVAVQSSDRFLETAVKKFEQLHPNIHIDIQEHLAQPKSEGGMSAAISQADMEKYVQTVTTQVIFGKASDLIAMDNLPQDKFVEKNMLVNLYDLMKNDPKFDKSRYYENILKSSQNGDGLYAMPFSFYLDGLLAGKPSMLKKAGVTIDDNSWTWDQFKDIAKKMQEQEGSDFVALINIFHGQLLHEYIEAYYTELVKDGSAHFDSDLFRSMMRQIKSMYDEGVLKAEFSYDYSKALFSQFGLYSPNSSLTDMLHPDTQYFLSPTLDGQSHGTSFRTAFTLGLNSKSEVQPEAWEFMKFLLSEETQSSPDLQGYPMDKSVVEKKIQDEKQKIERGEVELKGGVPDAKTVDEHILTLKKLLDSAGMKKSSDMKVVSIAMEEFESYMSGQKSEDDVSKLIQNRVTTYLNE